MGNLENFEISLLCLNTLMPGSFAVTNSDLNFHVCMKLFVFIVSACSDSRHLSKPFVLHGTKEKRSTRAQRENEI